MITRKMLNTRWLVASWMVGMLITVSLVSTIPIYTNGLLQNLLVKSIESQQASSNDDSNYPGGLTESLSLPTPLGRGKSVV